jgi:hypothetical protein
MAEQQSIPEVGYPTREIRITGERVALMFHTCIRVSRFEKSVVAMAMNGNRDARALVKAATERFNRAISNFEDELREAEKEIKAASQPSNRNNSGKATKPKTGSTNKPAQAAKPAQANKQPVNAPAAPATQPAAKPAESGSAAPKESAQPSKPQPTAAAAPAPKAQNPQAAQPNGGGQGKKQKQQGERNKGDSAKGSGNGQQAAPSNEATVIPLAEAVVL